MPPSSGNEEYKEKRPPPTVTERQDQTHPHALACPFRNVISLRMYVKHPRLSTHFFLNQGPTVSGLAEVEARTPEEIMDLLHQGNQNRTQQATRANAVSSRSHAVLQVDVLTVLIVFLAGVAICKPARRAAVRVPCTFIPRRPHSAQHGLLPVATVLFADSGRYIACMPFGLRRTSRRLASHCKSSVGGVGFGRYTQESHHPRLCRS